MGKFKYITERPTISGPNSESFQDFDGLLADVNRQDKKKLINQYLLLTAGFLLSGLLLYFIVFNTPATSNENPSPLMENKISNEDTTTQKKGDPIVNAEEHPDKGEKEKPVETLASADYTEPPENEDSFKIEETPVEENLFVQAEPKEGFENLYQYFDQSFNPTAPFDVESSSTNVLVSFKITEKGKIVDVRVDQPVHPMLDSLAMEAVKNMPQWKPATLNGEPIETKHQIPLFFNSTNN